jgi:hypothetical protein
MYEGGLYELNEVLKYYPYYVKNSGCVRTALSEPASPSLGVSTQLDLDEREACDMHDGDKLGQAATGKLIRSKGKISVNLRTAQFRAK